jgi:hypothetical protein
MATRALSSSNGFFLLEGLVHRAGLVQGVGQCQARHDLGDEHPGLQRQALLRRRGRLRRFSDLQIATGRQVVEVAGMGTAARAQGLFQPGEKFSAPPGIGVAAKKAFLATKPPRCSGG